MPLLLCRAPWHFVLADRGHKLHQFRRGMSCSSVRLVLGYQEAQPKLPAEQGHSRHTFWSQGRAHRAEADCWLAHTCLRLLLGAAVLVSLISHHQGNLGSPGPWNQLAGIDVPASSGCRPGRAVHQALSRLAACLCFRRAQPLPQPCTTAAGGFASHVVCFAAVELGSRPSQSVTGSPVIARAALQA